MGGDMMSDITLTRSQTDRLDGKLLHIKFTKEFLYEDYADFTLTIQDGELSGTNINLYIDIKE